ncbi:hypothetical protein GUJ93_ZPchr0013g37282 [Zizania palustris]|uniref:Uncharacterized protein n=1 Tax=Zizania palustris TaxID=103762 RepID=A0A8J6BZS5_ZIZPA|nr:hypothetical protein GUJ93_ZPchr0013g37282 [Zizania palustris]
MGLKQQYYTSSLSSPNCRAEQTFSVLSPVGVAARRTKTTVGMTMIDANPVVHERPERAAHLCAAEAAEAPRRRSAPRSHFPLLPQPGLVSSPVRASSRARPRAGSEWSGDVAGLHLTISAGIELKMLELSYRP